MSTITHLDSISSLDSFLSSRKDKLVVIDFHATWCGPCHAIAPKFESLSKQYQTQASFAKVDVDKAQAIAAKYGVKAMPTFVFTKNGTKVDEVRGANASALEAALKKHTSGISTTPSFPGSGQTLSSTSTSSSSTANQGQGWLDSPIIDKINWRFVFSLSLVAFWWYTGRGAAPKELVDAGRAAKEAAGL